MHGDISIRVATEGDLDALTDLWERSARSSHGFMHDDDFAAMRPYIRDSYLPSMDVHLAEANGQPLAFIGVRDFHVELLYVDPMSQGRGLGTLLLRRVSASSVEVYADNANGLGFYRSQGFRQVRSHDHDAAGRPYPMAVLQR